MTLISCHHLHHDIWHWSNSWKKYVSLKCCITYTLLSCVIFVFISYISMAAKVYRHPGCCSEANWQVPDELLWFSMSYLSCYWQFSTNSIQHYQHNILVSSASWGFWNLELCIYFLHQPLCEVLMCHHKISVTLSILLLLWILFVETQSGIMKK